MDVLLLLRWAENDSRNIDTQHKNQLKEEKVRGGHNDSNI